LIEWQHGDDAIFGRKPIPLRHNLAASPLFSDAALIRLIEASPRDRFHVNTMPRKDQDPRGWREGDMTGVPGAAVLEAVAKGNLWIHLQRVHETDGAYGELLDAVFADIAHNVQGFRSYKHSMSILISSPAMNVAYHADVPGQSLWQVRGRKRVWIYPAQAPFLPQQTRERIILKRSSDTDFGYEPDFDQQAEVYDLAPGDWATWPRMCPHRVVNDDCVNISFTTEHWTDELRAAYAVDYANGLLRPLLGDRDLSVATRGPGFWAKFALAGAHKALRSRADAALPLSIDFRVDPRADDGFVSIAPYQILK
jgi:hypothetical protein